MVAEGIVAGELCDALINSYIFRNLTVGNAYVHSSGLEIVDSKSGVARIPSNLERIRAIGYAELNKRIRKSCKVVNFLPQVRQAETAPKKHLL